LVERRERSVQVRVRRLPAWLDPARLLGPEFVRGAQREVAEATLSAQAAAEVCARLRGLGIDGAALSVDVSPPLGRTLVRAARLADARARRDTTKAFLRPGARASGEGHYSLTPEALAMALAETVASKRVVDACCGSGGNAVAFARAGCDVVAIDVDRERLAEAAHNAALYGVERRIRFIHGDVRALLPALSADVLFVDPPWGRDYDKRGCARADLPLLDALLALPSAVRARFAVWLLKLPASFATRELPGAEVRAVFGEAAGDYRRIKFIVAILSGVDARRVEPDQGTEPAR
jgi:predicted RNA methylase